MFEINYDYTKAEAHEVGDHYLGLMKQLNKMKRGRMMKVKSLSEISKRWLFISVAMICIAIVALLEFLKKGETYMLAFAAVVFAYGIGCIVSSIRDKKELQQYVPVLKGNVTIDKKGIREVRDGETVIDFTWKEFEYCIVTEKIMTFFGKNKGTVCVAFNEIDLNKFEHFLAEQKMDEDYVIKC